ncbi:MAG: HD domain-containing protein [Candidatus Omnitrophota bacterium]|nr:HD domain-containing protein [Candidatus Omnitrophota bacterium]
MTKEIRILLICDDEEITKFLREKLIIEKGYFVSFESSGSSGIASLRHNTFDAVIAKCPMRDLDSVEIVTGLKKIDPDCVIIAFVEQVNNKMLGYLYTAGIYDFITPPLNIEKLSFLVEKGVQLHTLAQAARKLSQGLKERNEALEKQNTLLAKRIEDSTKNLTRLYEDLRLTYLRTIKSLAQAIEARDSYTRSHSERVSKYAALIANEMGLSVKEIEIIREACELHDLGKIGISDNILGKPSALTLPEWEEIKKHPVIGAKILEPLIFLSDVVDLVRQHHEHYDGTGYPDGRSGEDILLGARIIHLADAYEAMCSPRAYREEPFVKEKAVLEIKINSGRQFDPKVVEAFLKVVDKF